MCGAVQLTPPPRPVNLGVTEADYEWLTEQLVCIANVHAQGRIVSVLEGGYRIHAGCASALGRSVAAHVRALAQPNAALWDGSAEMGALRAFWARRQQERAAAEAASAAAAAAAAAAAEAGEAPAPGPEDDGRRKRPRAAVDYAALALTLAEEAKAKAAAASM